GWYPGQGGGFARGGGSGRRGFGKAPGERRGAGGGGRHRCVVNTADADEHFRRRQRDRRRVFFGFEHRGAAIPCAEQVGEETIGAAALAKRDGTESSGQVAFHASILRCPRTGSAIT